MTTRTILLILIGLSFLGCFSTDTKCCDLVDRYSVSEGLYVEKYRTFCGGVFGELTECYLTDSVRFRKKIGSYDEHERFYVEQKGGKIVAYNLQTLSIPDTVEKKTLFKAEVWNSHDSAKNHRAIIPVFGKYSVVCDDFYPASSYKTEDGYHISQVQFKCGRDFSNAVFYTDSLHFSVFIGGHEPGSLSNNYSVRAGKDNTFDFYNVRYNRKQDTIKSEIFWLSDLRNGKLIKVCN